MTNKNCIHEYRAYPKHPQDQSTNEIFYCIHCLETVSRLFYSVDKVVPEYAIQEAQNNTAMQCYLECLAVECGEGECSRAIVTKFGLEVKNDQTN